MFTWEPEQQKTFNAIQHALFNVTLMVHPQPNRLFTIDCNAAAQELGNGLQQRDEQGRERPICFSSRVFKPNEREWATTKHEGLCCGMDVRNVTCVYQRVPNLSAHRP